MKCYFWGHGPKGQGEPQREKRLSGNQGNRRQETGDRRQETEDRRQETGDRRQETEDRKQETGDRRQKTDGRTDDGRRTRSDKSE